MKIEKITLILFVGFVLGVVSIMIYNKYQVAHVQSFTNKYAPIFINIQKETGVSAIALLSQMALETGWGSNILRLRDDSGNPIESNNLFNIKASPDWGGKTGWRYVWEDTNRDGDYDFGEDSKEYFRVYKTPEDGVRDYILLVSQHKIYAKAWEVRSDPLSYINELGKAGYATDGLYAKKIHSIINTFYEKDM